MCYSSIRQYMNIIRIMHAEWGLPNPLEDNYRLTITLRGIRRERGDSTLRKAPITPDMLHAILRALNTQNRAAWAAALAMFYGLLRRSNIMPTTAREFDPTRHLRRRDALFTPTGVNLTIRWSKTNQYRGPARVIPLPRMTAHPLCPTQAIYNACRTSPEAPREGPLLHIGPPPGGGAYGA